MQQELPMESKRGVWGSVFREHIVPSHARLVNKLPGNMRVSRGWSL